MTRDEPRLASPLEWTPVATAHPEGGANDLLATLPDGRGFASAVGGESDSVGLKLRELTVTRTPGDGDPPLGERASQLAGSVRGLLETLRVYEVDAERDEAVLRSDSPRVHGDDCYYYEVRLQGQARATLRRYGADRAAGTPREAVPFTLTHEAAALVADDLAR